MIDDQDELSGAVVPVFENNTLENKHNASFGEGDNSVSPVIEMSPKAN